MSAAPCEGVQGHGQQFPCIPPLRPGFGPGPATGICAPVEGARRAAEAVIVRKDAGQEFG